MHALIIPLDHEMMVGMRMQEARNDLVAVRKKQRKPHVQEHEEWNGIQS
jgi:hypothetical protein